MRVVAGSARGVRLAGPVDYGGTRPISDRAKEAMFSILGDLVPGARVLDVFAGVGNVGIEALSRGAAAATFVELSDGPVADIRANLGRARVADRARVVQADAFAFLARPPEPHDLVFMGPPQWEGLWSRALRALAEAPGWLAEDGVAVVQCDPKEYEDLALPGLAEADARAYGNVQLGFFRRADAERRVDRPEAE